MERKSCSGLVLVPVQFNLMKNTPGLLTNTLFSQGRFVFVFLDQLSKKMLQCSISIKTNNII